MHSAATSSSSFAGAVAAGKIQLRDLPSGPIVEIDNRIPASFVIHAKNLRMAITPIAGSSRGKTMYYGPITGQLKLVTSTTGKVTVLDNGKPVKARPAAARAISLGYSTKKGSFTGKLRSKASGCVARQQVQVLARKGHSWARAGAARTSKKGAFTIKYGRRAGQYYATIPAGQPGCAAARSKTVTLGR